MIIICSFAVAILLFLSNFGLCGIVGEILKGMQLGLFGILGYLLPLLIFIGTCFYLSNQGNIHAAVKLGAVIVAVLTPVSYTHLDVYKRQAQMGKKVSSANMQPGDLIFYAGSSGKVNHVAIYIGNGRIVHAASRRSGIKTSTWNYRTPVAIRSMLD